MKFVINLILLLSFFPAKAKTVIGFQAKINPEAKILADLLNINPDSAHWGKIKLDASPHAGQRLSQQQVIGWLQRKKGKFSYQWQGKKTIFVHQTIKTKASALINQAQIALTTQLQKQGYQRIILNNKTHVDNSSIPLKNFQISLPTGYPIAKRACVYLRYKKKSIPIWFAVKAYQSVLVAKNAIKAHRLVTRKELFLQMRNIAGINKIPLTQLPEVAWSRNFINKNQLVAQEDFNAPPEISQGQKAQVKVQQHGVSILIDALAQKDAYLGQVIRMKNRRSNKYFWATVTGKNQAEVKE